MSHAKGVRALCLVVMLFVAACGKQQSVATVDLTRQPPPPSFVPEMATTSSLQSDAVTVRFVAIRHELKLETVHPEEVEPLWRKLQQTVSNAGGELLQSELSSSDRMNPVAQLSFRVVPTQVDKVFLAAKTGGAIVSQKTASDDVTAEVIDVEAKLKNLIESRDRMRTLLATRPGKLSDVVELEEALTEKQSEIDSLTGRRKALAQDTEKVRFDIEIGVTRSVVERSAVEPLRLAWQGLGSMFFASVGSVLSWFAVILPWVVPFSILYWLFRRWRRARVRTSIKM